MPDGESLGIRMCGEYSPPERTVTGRGIDARGNSNPRAFRRTLLWMVFAMQTKTDISGGTKNRGRENSGRGQMVPYLTGDAHAYPSSTVMVGRVMMLHTLMRASGFDELREVWGMEDV